MDQKERLFDSDIEVKFDQKNVLRVWTYHVTLNASKIGKFRKIVIDSLPSNINLREGISQLCERWIELPIKEEKDALYRAISIDLQKLLKTDYENSIKNYNFKRNVKEIIELFEKNLDIDLSDIEIFVVDNYPEPYSKWKASAVAFDQGDYKKYGIKPGIWIKRSAIKPFYTEYLISHELVHKVAEKSNPFAIGRGLEEGLAMLYGSLYIFSQVFGENVAKNLLFYDYFFYPSSDSVALYRHYFKLAVILYLMGGVDLIESLIVQGRDKIRHGKEFLSWKTIKKYHRKKG